MQKNLCVFVSQICFALFFPVYVSLSPFSVSLSLTQPHKHTPLRPLCHFTRRAAGSLLGLGDEQRVGEEEEVSVLRLQASLQLCLGVTQE